MNLQCEVVEDLYPLYIENELSEKVRTAVEEHLNTCVSCKKVYEDTDCIEIQMIKDDLKSPSAKTYDNLMIKLKRTRIIIAIIVFICFILTAIFSSLIAQNKTLKDNNKYIQRAANRMAVSRDLLYISGQTQQLVYLLCFVKSDKTPELMGEVFSEIVKEDLIKHNEDYKEVGMRHGKEDYDDMIENKIDISSIESNIRLFNNYDGDFNEDLSDSEKTYIDKYYNNDHLSFSYDLNGSVKIMAERYKNNQWTKEDETTFNEFKKLLTDFDIYIYKQSQELRKNTSGSITNKIYDDLDMKEIISYHRQINDLTKKYYDEHKKSK